MRFPQVEAFGATVPLDRHGDDQVGRFIRWQGILVALAAKFVFLVHSIGVGEGENDLQPFDAAGFRPDLLTGVA